MKHSIWHTVIGCRYFAQLLESPSECNLRTSLEVDLQMSNDKDDDDNRRLVVKAR